MMTTNSLLKIHFFKFLKYRGGALLSKDKIQHFLVCFDIKEKHILKKLKLGEV